MVDRDERLDVTRAINIADQVAWALDVAHGQGLVHRDVKPETILLAPSRGAGEPDHAYLADFGIAKLEDAPSVTRTGAFLGTATYASPEQARAETVDGRSDQYSLACVLFECLTGRPPFAGADVAEVLAAHREARRPRASEHRPTHHLGARHRSHHTASGSSPASVASHRRRGRPRHRRGDPRRRSRR
jgi:serine/threonine-protein kinase